MTKRNLFSSMDSVFWMLILNYVSLFAAALSNLYIYSNLGPLFAGAVAEVMIFVQIVIVVCSIVRASLDREVPVLQGRGEASFAEKFWDAAFWTHFLISIAGALLIVSLFCFSSQDEDLKYAIWAGIALVIISSFLEFSRVALKLQARFRLLGVVNSCTKTVLEATKSGCVYFLGNTGFALSTFACMLLASPVYAKLLCRKFVLPDTSTLKKIFSVGFPITFFSHTMLILVTIERIVIRSLFGRQLLGCFSIPVILLFVTEYLPSSFTVSVLGPYWIRLISGRKKLRALLCMISSAYLSSILTCIVYIPFCLMLPEIIRRFLPEYKQATVSCILLVWAAYWMFQCRLFLNVLKADGKYRVLVLTSLAAIVITLSSNSLSSAYGISGIAASILLASIFTSNTVVSRSLSGSKLPVKTLVELLFIVNFTGLLGLSASFIPVLSLLAVFPIIYCAGKKRKAKFLFRSYLAGLNHKS